MIIMLAVNIVRRDVINSEGKEEEINEERGRKGREEREGMCTTMGGECKGVPQGRSLSSSLFILGN